MPLVSNNIYLDEEYIQDCKEKINYFNGLSELSTDVISNSNYYQFKVIKKEDNSTTYYKLLDNN